MFGILERAGCSTLANCLLCVCLGLILYVASLQAQGVSILKIVPHIRNIGRIRV